MQGSGPHRRRAHVLPYRQRLADARPRGPCGALPAQARSSRAQRRLTLNWPLRKGKPWIWSALVQVPPGAGSGMTPPLTRVTVNLRLGAGAWPWPLTKK